MTFDENIKEQEALAQQKLNLEDDSQSIKDNKELIDRDTHKYSPTKGILQTANEIVDEAEYNPPVEKIQKRALEKLQEVTGQAADQLDEVLNYKSKDAPTESPTEAAARARIERADAYDIAGPNSDEYKAAKEKEDKLMSDAGYQSMTYEDAQKIIQDYQDKVDSYNAIDAAKNDYMLDLQKHYKSQLEKIINDDTKSWTERRKLIDKAGLLFGNIMQNLGATMHNIANPNNWIYAQDPITMRMGQNLANTVKNRQTNNDTYIDSQVEYWKGVLPEYVDASKLKQKLSNSKILNTYKRLDEAQKKMIVALSTSDAWETVSNNALLSFMDSLQSGEYTSVTQIAAAAVAAMMTSSKESVDTIVNKLDNFFKMIGVDPAQVKKLVDTGGKVISGAVSGVGAAADGISNAYDNVSGLFKKGKK